MKCKRVRKVLDMKAERITAKDVRNISVGGKLEVELPSYLACVAAKGMVTYVKRAYPRTDGNVYYTFINSESNTITIGLTDPHLRDIIIGENVKCRKRVET